MQLYQAAMTLPDVLTDDDRRAALVADCVNLLDSEVGRKKGMTGLAIKGGYKVVKKLDGGRMVPKAINDLLPEFCAAWEPYHLKYRESDAQNFASWGVGKEHDLAEALLAITDGKADHAKNKVLKKVYVKLRPNASKNIVDALPGVTRLVDQYVTR